jgi:hypothetical protein
MSQYLAINGCIDSDMARAYSSRAAAPPHGSACLTLTCWARLG